MAWLKQTLTLCDKIPKENKHYTCIACITIHSVMRMEKKNYPQVYLEKCKYRMKKTRMTKFVETKLKSESESELKSDTELEAKLKSDSGSDSESVILLSIIFIMFLTIHRGRLTNFELVKNLAVILLTLKKSKKIFVKISSYLHGPISTCVSYLSKFILTHMHLYEC